MSSIPWIAILATALWIFAGCDPMELDVSDDDTCVDGATTKGNAGTMWVTICGAAYQMGNNTNFNEGPKHAVTIPTFEMLATEVTVSQYAQCPSPGVCSEPATDDPACNWAEVGYEDHPVNCVEWQQAVDFCTWLGGRLPTEAEWEYAARSGGQDIEYPWGSEVATCDYAVMDDGGPACGQERTWLPCSKSPDGDTDQGLCDMAGNVGEFIQDLYHHCYDCSQCPGTGGCDSTSIAPDDGSAWEAPPGLGRVGRDGGYISGADWMRTFARYNIMEGVNAPAMGFRCVR